MNHNPLQSLHDFKPTRDFFIGIDSDGCVFDTMELKHKECFIPTTIRHFELQIVSKYAREAAEFVNLYSQWRGSNRFPALLKVLELLDAREEVRRRDANVPRLAALRTWTEREKVLSNTTLKLAITQDDATVCIDQNPEDIDELRAVLAWSEDVNAAIKAMMPSAAIFPGGRECLATLAPRGTESGQNLSSATQSNVAARRADLIVCSATPSEALAREWAAHDLAGYVQAIAGQEIGSKADHLRIAAGGKYAKDRALMIGDAPGDLKAARANGFLFYPILPGAEEASWKRLHDEAIDRFFAGRFAGAYEEALVGDFDALLPATPPWQKR